MKTSIMTSASADQGGQIKSKYFQMSTPILPQYSTVHDSKERTASIDHDCFKFNWDYLQSAYFEVTTASVSTNLQSALSIDSTLLDSILQTTAKADLYGPIWIVATTALTIFIASEMGRAWSTRRTDFRGLVKAAGWLYGWMAGEGVGVWASVRWVLGVGDACELSPALVMMLVGYSFALLPALILVAVIPWALTRWLTLATAAILSCLFISRNAHFVISRQPGVKQEQVVILMALWLVIHASLFAAIKIYFF